MRGFTLNTDNFKGNSVLKITTFVNICSILARKEYLQANEIRESNGNFLDIGSNFPGLTKNCPK